MSGNGNCKLGPAQIEAMDLERIYRIPGQPAVAALKGCSLTVEKGKLTVLVGPSGCGKTTLANILAGYDTPTAGQALINGQPIKGPGRDRLMVFQETALWPWMTVLNNATFGPTVSGAMNRQEAESRAMLLLDKVGLKDFKDKYPAQLSGGMQQRLALAQALIMRPRVLLLDEPFGALDPGIRAEIHVLMKRLWNETNLTVVMVTHDMREAFTLGTRVIAFERPRDRPDERERYGASLSRDIDIWPPRRAGGDLEPSPDRDDPVTSEGSSQDDLTPSEGAPA